MPIKFYLLNEPDYSGKPRVKQFYELIEGQKVNELGKVVPIIDLQGHVDEGIKQAHPSEYSAFNSYVEANAETLYPLAIETGEKIYPMVVKAAEQAAEAPAGEVTVQGKKKGKK